jgi:hypothetical protein
MREELTESIAKTTPNITQHKVEQLRQIFPECVSEGRVDFDSLRATLGDADALVDEDAYSFTWAGKQEAFRAIQTPSAPSLAPAPEESWEPPAGDGAEALAEQLAFFDRGLKEGADPRHVIYEVILKLGYSLNAPIEPLDLESNRVYRVTSEPGQTLKTLKVLETFRVSSPPPHLYICLDDEIHDATIDALPLDKETTFVCLDMALDDSQKVNLAMQCLLKVI